MCELNECCRDDTSQEGFVSSRYNFHVPMSDGGLLYNASSGAVIQLSGDRGLDLAKSLTTAIVSLAGDELPPQVFQALRTGGFVVPSGFNELEPIRERFLEARRDTPVFLTLTTTQDCNLGCYYCYEERAKTKLGLMDVEGILQWIISTFSSRSDRFLHVDWYGGEPLLNIDFIERASPAIQECCKQNGIRYTASIISNGTLWPDDAGGFAKRHKIQQAQISFDGLRENHNERRRYRAAFKPEGEASSFDAAVRVVDALLDVCRVDVRLNLDRANYCDLTPFIDFARSRGWFDRKFPCVFMPARLTYYTARSKFMRKLELGYEQLDELRNSMREATAAGLVVTDEPENKPDAFAYPRNSVCAALARGSQVVGADGLIYRCGLQVGDKTKAVGSLAAGNDDQQYPNASWWGNFDPTVLPNCSRCSFLPVCWGGCPLKHLDNDTQALDERSRFWRTHLPRLITSRFGLTPPPAFAFSEADQFR